MKRFLLTILAVTAITLCSVFTKKTYAQSEVCTVTPGGTGWCRPYYVNNSVVGYYCGPDAISYPLQPCRLF
jgi:hypothetical protein